MIGINHLCTAHYGKTDKLYPYAYKTNEKDIFIMCSPHEKQSLTFFILYISIIETFNHYLRVFFSILNRL